MPLWMKRHPVCVGAFLGAIVAILYSAPFVSLLFQYNDFSDGNQIAIGVVGFVGFFIVTVILGAIVGTYSAVGALASRAVVRRACRRLTVTRESIGAALGSSIAVSVPLLPAGLTEPTYVPAFGFVPLPAFLVAGIIAGGAAYAVNRVQIRPQSI
ncbi:hypothetical protein C5C44_03205 [Rathayibacter sp. AY1F6]|uniref:hypothetical protein n=1 Tax=Rathayibacter sp. AY1F6 TaxID=2080560 RepID=UPI000D40D14C|nr:hypothetical protein [Rathayibacter sp. AY1F6]PPH05745.1 hypothetical protein C5C44_03205 [Rathayibacter sp. AY1F6]